MTSAPFVAIIPDYVQALFEQIPLSLQVFTPDGFLLARNDAHRAMWNVSDKNIIGRFNMVTELQMKAQGMDAAFMRALEGEAITAPRSFFDTNVPDYAGQTAIWVEGIFFPLRDADGSVTHVGMSQRDVTHEVNQLKAIAQAQAEIASQQQTIETLSSPVV